VHGLPLWPKEQQRDFIHNRVRELLLAEKMPDDQLPECTPQETWSEVRDYAVIKEGGKRAIKCYDKNTLILEHDFRSGEMAVQRMTPRKRCLNHCSASPVCCQHERLLREEGRDPWKTNVTDLNGEELGQALPYPGT
jgi:hypothetical protein